MTDLPKPEFDEIERLLAATGASWEAAEAHGALAGRACLSGAAAIRAWVTDLLAEVDSGDVLASERKATLETMAASVLLSLEAGDLSFQLLLPDDDTGLDVRTAALADWCHGFMHGLVTAGGADEGPQSDALEAEVVSEILDDFSEITKVGAAQDEGEEAEAAYVELTEYVRVSAQLIYDETAALRKQTTTGGSA